MKTWSRILLAMPIALLFIGCQQEDIPKPEIESHFVKNEVQDELAHSFGKLLAASLKDKPIRDFVKSEASLQFDGDYDILFAMAKDKEIQMENGRGKMSFAQAILSADENARTDISEYDQLLTDLAMVYPTMQISVPQLEGISAEDWSTNEYLPLVAIVKSDFDETVTTEISAYDSAGNLYELSSKVEPSNLVIVISPSERIEAFPVNASARIAIEDPLFECVEQQQAFYSTENYNYYLTRDIQICMDGGGTGGSGGSSSGTLAQCREMGNEEYVHRLKIKQWNGIEDWWQGAPEINLEVYAPKYDYRFIKHTGDMEPQYRKDIDDEWWNVGGEKGKYLFDWIYGYIGENVKYLWYERDEPLIGYAERSISLSTHYIETDGTIVNKQTPSIALLNPVRIGNRDDVITDVDVTIVDSGCEWADNPVGFKKLKYEDSGFLWYDKFN